MEHVKGGGLSSLFGASEATPGVLCAVLGFPVQKRHGHTEDSPAKGHEDDKETGAFSPVRKVKDS